MSPDTQPNRSLITHESCRCTERRQPQQSAALAIRVLGDPDHLLPTVVARFGHPPCHFLRCELEVWAIRPREMHLATIAKYRMASHARIGPHRCPSSGRPSPALSTFSCAVPAIVGARIDPRWRICSPWSSAFFGWFDEQDEWLALAVFVVHLFSCIPRLAQRRCDHEVLGLQLELVHVAVRVTMLAFVGDFLPAPNCCNGSTPSLARGGPGPPWLP